MKWFRNLKVAMKVMMCCLIFILLLIGGSLFAVSSITRTEQDIDRFYANRVKPVIWGDNIYKNVLQARVNMYAIVDALNENNKKEIEMRVADYLERKAVNEQLWKQYKAIPMGTQEKVLAERFEKEYGNLIGSFDHFMAAVNANDNVAMDRVMVEWISHYQKARNSMDDVLKFQIDAGEKMIEVNRFNASDTQRMLVVVLAFSIASGLLVTYVLAHSVSGPVAKGLAFAKKIAAGDFTERIDLDQTDELGELGKALNAAADSLENIVIDVVQASLNLAQSIKEIASGNENLSRRTNEQASSLEEVASTIEESFSSINQSAANSKTANKLSEKTTIQAEEGSHIVFEAVAAIKEINEASKKIENITSVINAIAFQTNLLALNAAVEAARAGEQGRGFAVVASEVRNLAHRSGSAAKEIGDLIKTTLLKVENGTLLATKSGEALIEIVTSIKDVNRLVSNIDAASEEQKQGASQIHIAVNELDSMTQQNAGLVEEIASVSEAIPHQAQELLSMMKKFKTRQDSRYS